MTSASKLAAATVLAIACLALNGATASAEWFADAYAGGTLTTDHDVEIRDAAGRSTFQDVEFRTGLAYGLRVGRYFDAAPFVGLAVDYYNFSADIGGRSFHRDGCSLVGGCVSGPDRVGRLSIDAMALSLDLLLRLPLFKTAEEPHGVLQPYVSAGVPVFMTTVTPRTSSKFRNHEDATEFSFGYKAAAGVSVRVYKNLHLFGEYRFTHTDVDEHDLRSSIAGKASLDTELNTHAALIGLSVRW
jgi:opacity protein-like surface antigen